MLKCIWTLPKLNMVLMHLLVFLKVATIMLISLLFTTTCYYVRLNSSHRNTFFCCTEVIKKSSCSLLIKFTCLECRTTALISMTMTIQLKHSNVFAAASYAAMSSLWLVSTRKRLNIYFLLSHLQFEPFTVGSHNILASQISTCHFLVMLIKKLNKWWSTFELEVPSPTTTTTTTHVI